ncbi:MAG: hypothetical protein ACI8SE_000806 [Bacteroidia bacterium]|jgi:hypothetical protein
MILVTLGCNTSTKKSTKTDRIPEPDMLLRLAGQKAEIDSNRMTKNLMAKIFAMIPEVQKPIEVLDLQWPKEIDEVYNIWYSSDTQIVCVGAYPFSESGDWDLGLTHYFDKDGNTFAFERNTSFYNSLCTDELAIEQIVMYYAGGEMVDSVYVFKDLKGNDLDQDSCSFPYDFPYRVYTNQQDVMRAVGLTR